MTTSQVSTQEDRVIAGVCHLTPFIGFPVIAPFAVYFWKKEDRFIASHALQAAIFHLAAIPVMICGYIFGLFASIGLGIFSQAAHSPGAELFGMFGAGGLLALGFAAPALCMLIVTLFASYRAFNGLPVRIPIIGFFVEKILDAPTAPAAPAAP